MTNKNNTELFEKLLVSFCQEEDHMKEMLQWMTNQLMEIEKNNFKTQTEKGEHHPDRKTYRNGYRVRRWDTRLGTLYLTIPKVRQGGYQLFFSQQTTIGSRVNVCYPKMLNQRCFYSENETRI